MEIKNIMSIMVVAIVGAVILTGFLPVIGATQDNIGEPIILTNESYEYVALSDGDVNVSYSSGAFSVNGEPQTVTARGGQIIFACDYVIVWFNGSVPYGSYLTQASGIRNITAFDLSVTVGKLNGSITYDNNVTQTVTDQDITFSFYFDPNGEYSVFDLRNTHPYIAKDTDVVAVGTFYTGDNKTFYWYYNGVAGGVVPDYTYNATIEKSKANGMIDIYTLDSVTFDISGETFTPFYMIVQKDITGHSASGALYDIYALIPLIVAVGLLMFVITAILIRRV